MCWINLQDEHVDLSRQFVKNKGAQQQKNSSLEIILDRYKARRARIKFLVRIKDFAIFAQTDA